MANPKLSCKTLTALSATPKQGNKKELQEGTLQSPFRKLRTHTQTAKAKTESSKLQTEITEESKPW